MSEDQHVKSFIQLEHKVCLLHQQLLSIKSSILLHYIKLYYIISYYITL